jgi:hypothetical protein
MKKLAKAAAALSTALSSLVLGAAKVAAQTDWDWTYDTTTSAADSGAIAAFTGMSLLCQIPMCIIGVAGLAFTIWMIVDAAKRDESVLPGKIKWILLMVLTGWIGALIYFFARKKKMD